jgi:hypothetical protein
MVRARVGLDFRVTREFAISPVLGGDASLFLTRSGPATSGFENISSPRVNFFLFAGLESRFDLGGSRGQYTPYAGAPDATTL